MSSFANLKRNRSDFAKLTKAIEATTQPAEAGSKEDTRFWQPEVDKAGNGMAIIRFLPAPAADGDDALPWVRVFSHGFQGPGGWFIDNCLTTLNEKCPVCEHNNTLWNSGIEANKDIARKQKRKLSYVANILVISDPANKENEGQIRLFKFGKKIFDKITEAMNPEFADETPVNPFDMWEGANFKLKIRNVEGYRNYDKSEFADKSALFDGDDEKLESLWKSEHGLKDFTEKKQFKSYDQLKTRLDKVLGFDGVANAPKTKAADSVVSSIKDDDVSMIDKSISDDDGDLDYFKSLAEQN
jgi:hypothetical protein